MCLLSRQPPRQAWQDRAVDRQAGYRQALASADIPFDPEIVAEGNWQPGGGYHATLQILKAKRPPTAIFCANDRVALGCCDALKQHGLRSPEDVSVVGFDDDDLEPHGAAPENVPLPAAPHGRLGRRAGAILTQ